MLHGKEGSSIPLNIFPTAPSFENTLVPVPVVLSPAAGYICPNLSSTFQCTRGFRATHSLLDGLMNASGELIFFQRRVSTLLEILCCAVTVHCVRSGRRIEKSDDSVDRLFKVVSRLNKR